MGEEKHDGLVVPGRVVLARQPAFDLGPLTISPPTREIINGSKRHTIEPRVMQLLVMLAKAPGDVVSRDELIDRCWDGRIVGDDAINHAIGKLRQIGVETGGAFRIETIPRVGFRLLCEQRYIPDSDHSEEPMEDGKIHSTRRVVIGSGLALGAIAIGGASVAFLSRNQGPSRLSKMYYERGLATRGQGFSNEYEQAVAYFRKAVEIEPDYADAWGALAWSYRVLIATGDDSNARRLMALGTSAAHRALELDADNADARLALLLMKPHYRRWAEVEEGCRALLAQHPQHSITQFHLAFVLSETGRWREAIPHMEAVCNREPTWPMARFRLFEELSNVGRVEEADARIHEAMRLAPRNGDFWSSKIDHLLLTGRAADATALLADKAARPNDDDRLIDQQSMIVNAYTNASPERRKATVARLLQDARTHLLRVAEVAAMLRDLDMTFAILNGVYLGRGPWKAKMESRPPTHPLFSAATASLRHDERFDSLLAETGLEAFWRKTKTTPDFRVSSSV
jgi:DNA-binding winged helix-turn-helix (wHTH) protein/Flp pilus assembly protein TadD